MQDETRTEQGPGHAIDEQIRAPEHIVTLVLGLMRQRPGPVGPPPGTVDYARAAREAARVYADSIWGEAWLTGAAWGRAYSPSPIRVVVTAERLAELDQAVS